MAEEEKVSEQCKVEAGTFSGFVCLTHDGRAMEACWGRLEEAEQRAEGLAEEVRCITADRDSWRQASQENKVESVRLAEKGKALAEAMRKAESLMFSGHEGAAHDVLLAALSAWDASQPKVEQINETLRQCRTAPWDRKPLTEEQVQALLKLGDASKGKAVDE